ncbi:retrovirus-related pol polyprotein from transposon TNT 1-94 [Tanacetum coccineum]
MTGNKAYLADFQDYNGGPVAFGGSKGYITGKGKIKTGKLDFEDVSFVKELQPFNLFSVSQMCDKKNKAYLVGQFFLRTKDETSAILKDFIRQIENQLNQKVKIIRCDNGTEFKNKEVIEFCGLKGIKREYSNARTPQQNGVAERKNRTPLIESFQGPCVADSFVPNTLLGAEAVKYCLLCAKQETKNFGVLPEAAKSSGTNIFSIVSTTAKARGTNFVNTVSMPVSTASSAEGLSISETSNFQEDDSKIPPLEDIHEDATGLNLYTIILMI